MTDMPHWRAWADAAHRDSMRTHRSKNPRYRCSVSSCPHSTTKNQAKINGGLCHQCKAPLKATLNGQKF